MWDKPGATDDFIAKSFERVEKYEQKIEQVAQLALNVAFGIPLHLLFLHPDVDRSILLIEANMTSTATPTPALLFRRQRFCVRVRAAQVLHLNDSLTHNCLVSAHL